MGISVLVLYPKTDDSTFDLDYYKKSHMPMVAEEFSSFGFNGYRVVSLISNADQSAAAYSIQCSLEFDNVDGLQRGLKERGAKILGDVPNFSNKSPIMIVGDVVADTTS